MRNIKQQPLGNGSCLCIANRLKNDYSQCPDMWKKIQLIIIKIMSLGYNSGHHETTGRRLWKRELEK
ncbi:hypothetical protein [Symbiopectobacterium sp. RP]|uniref:hypothetical protein n=1 Tax=Symbiopectobacterium sp. RP TaxID=3248553 RepID=UPI003D289C44